jgi:hypothetical protein
MRALNHADASDRSLAPDRSQRARFDPGIALDQNPGGARDPGAGFGYGGGVIRRTAWLLALLLSGCATIPEAGRARVHHFVFGLAGGAELDVRDLCPSGKTATIEVYRSFSAYVASILSLGMYVPYDVRLRCVPRARP